MPSTPSRTNYTFDTWCIDSQRTIPVNWSTYTVAGNANFYAKWLSNPSALQYMIIFDNGDNASFTDPLYINAGQALPNNPPDSPTRSGYSFAGWYYNSACSSGQEVDWGDYVPIRSTIFYAKWSIDDPNVVETYTIRFENGILATTTAPITGLKLNDYISSKKPGNPTRSDSKAFEGWFTDYELLNAVNWSSYRVTGDAIFYAKWDATVDPPPLDIPINLIPDNGAPVFQMGKERLGWASVGINKDKTWTSSAPSVMSVDASTGRLTLVSTNSDVYVTIKYVLNDNSGQGSKTIRVYAAPATLNPAYSSPLTGNAGATRAPTNAGDISSAVSSVSGTAYYSISYDSNSPLHSATVNSSGVITSVTTGSITVSLEIRTPAGKVSHQGTSATVNIQVTGSSGIIIITDMTISDELVPVQWLVINGTKSGSGNDITITIPWDTGRIEATVDMTNDAYQVAGNIIWKVNGNHKTAQDNRSSVTFIPQALDTAGTASIPGTGTFQITVQTTVNGYPASSSITVEVTENE
jgi:uncharacterized repeat protein (TIGR02543 family)